MIFHTLEEIDDYYLCTRIFILALLFANVALVAGGLNENAQLALLPVLFLREQIGQEEREAAVVVQPPDVHETRVVLAIEDVDALQHALVDGRILKLDELRALGELAHARLSLDERVGAIARRLPSRHALRVHRKVLIAFFLYLLLLRIVVAIRLAIGNNNNTITTAADADLIVRLDENVQLGLAAVRKLRLTCRILFFNEPKLIFHFYFNIFMEWKISFLRLLTIELFAEQIGKVESALEPQYADAELKGKHFAVLFFAIQ